MCLQDRSQRHTFQLHIEVEDPVKALGKGKPARPLIMAPLKEQFIEYKVMTTQSDRFNWRITIKVSRKTNHNIRQNVSFYTTVMQMQSIMMANKMISK